MLLCIGQPRTLDVSQASLSSACQALQARGMEPSLMAGHTQICLSFNASTQLSQLSKHGQHAANPKLKPVIFSHQYTASALGSHGIIDHYLIICLPPSIHSIVLGCCLQYEAVQAALGTDDIINCPLNRNLQP